MANNKQKPSEKAMADELQRETERGLLALAKRDKFVRLANARVNKLLSQIVSFSKLSNTQVYSYTPDDVAEISQTVLLQWEKAVSKFAQGSVQKEEGFRLGG